MSSPHVLIVSTVLDLATDAVVRELTRMGVRVTRWNTEQFPFWDGATISFDDGVHAEICSHPYGVPQPLDDVTSVWYRKVRTPEKPEDMDRGVYDFCIREGRTAIVGLLLGGLPDGAHWTSHPSRIWAAENKPYQLRTAQRVGLTIPHTVITNWGQHIRAAHRSFDKNMVAKPARSGYVEVEGEPFAIYTSKVDAGDLADLSDVESSPAIYQPLIQKEADIRITVVGDRIFSARIDSQGDPAAQVDWRHTADPDLPHSTFDLPSGIDAQIRAFMNRLDLRFGALDFVLTPNGELIFLEVNPNGQWLWLDDRLDEGITKALALHLAHGI